MYAEDRELTGTLMKLSEDPLSRFTFEIWFNYTRKGMNEIREGTLVVVPNFASNGSVMRQSVLEITSILPMHYALGTDTGGYPGFVVEAAQNAALDWESQEDESTEDTTKIRVSAIPTNLEIVEEMGKSPGIGTESNIPMVGSQVRLLDKVTTEIIANYGINKEFENTTAIGSMIRDRDVKVLVRIEDLLKTHFGIFGFTGQGKSNLMSTLVTKVLSETREPVKILLFDLMGEYTALLLDQLLRDNMDTYVLCLGEKSLPGPVFSYINKEVPPSEENLNRAAEALVRFTLLPKALLPMRDQVRTALSRLIQKDIYRVFSTEENMTVFDVFYDKDNPDSLQSSYYRLGQEKKNRCKQIVRESLPGNVAAKMSETLVDNALAKSIQTKLGEKLAENDDLGARFEGVLKQLKLIERQTAKPLRCAITLAQLESLLNNPEKSGLFIVTTHSPDDLREFSHTLGEAMYESRRKTGRIEPLVSFIFDEADEFIPQKVSGSYGKSVDIAHTLARRGRKFGLGIGIATQRIVYLDTSIMAQPHTYLISKLPRKSDRERLAEAFGISEDMFRQTFKFQKGNWLLVSHDATGLEAVPLPIMTEDANKRIGKFLEAGG